MHRIQEREETPPATYLIAVLDKKVQSEAIMHSINTYRKSIGNLYPFSYVQKKHPSLRTTYTLPADRYHTLLHGFVGPTLPPELIDLIRIYLFKPHGFIFLPYATYAESVAHPDLLDNMLYLWGCRAIADCIVITDRHEVKQDIPFVSVAGFFRFSLLARLGHLISYKKGASSKRKLYAMPLFYSSSETLALRLEQLFEAEYCMPNRLSPQFLQHIDNITKEIHKVCSWGERISLPAWLASLQKNQKERHAIMEEIDQNISGMLSLHDYDRYLINEQTALYYFLSDEVQSLEEQINRLHIFSIKRRFLHRVLRYLEEEKEALMRKS